MNKIKKEEMFGNLKNFLKSKGIAIEDGSYADGIRKGCEILTDTVNLSQRAVRKAKVAVDQGLDQVRQTVHERTAPKTSPGKKSDAKAKPSAAPRAAKRKK